MTHIRQRSHCFIHNRCLSDQGDFKEANYLNKEIVEDTWNDDKSWEYFKEKYQPLYNKLKTQFKLEHKKRGMKI